MDYFKTKVWLIPKCVIKILRGAGMVTPSNPPPPPPLRTNEKSFDHTLKDSDILHPCLALGADFDKKDSASDVYPRNNWKDFSENRPILYLTLSGPAFQSFARPGGVSEAKMTKIKVNITRLKWNFTWVIMTVVAFLMQNFSLVALIVLEIWWQKYFPLKKGTSQQIRLFTPGKRV